MGLLSSFLEKLKSTENENSSHIPSKLSNNKGKQISTNSSSRKKNSDKYRKMKHTLFPTTDLGCLPPRKKARKVIQTTTVTPTEYLERAFLSNGYSKDKVQEYAKSQMITITCDMISSYTMDVTKAVRNNDLETLTKLYNIGGTTSLSCCNKFGDSLVHIACRHGHTEILKFLVEIAQVPIHRQCDVQRTPLHDACWRPTPNYEIVDILLKRAPSLVFCTDKRGCTPFEYSRSEHTKGWIEFLSKRTSLLVLHQDKNTNSNNIRSNCSNKDGGSTI